VTQRDVTQLARVSFQTVSEGSKQDAIWMCLPDLLIVDGGKGQLNMALEVLEEYGLRKVVSMAALAKQRGGDFSADQSEPVVLPRGSNALHLYSAFAMKRTSSRHPSTHLAPQDHAVLCFRRHPWHWPPAGAGFNPTLWLAGSHPAGSRRRAGRRGWHDPSCRRASEGALIAIRLSVPQGSGARAPSCVPFWLTVDGCPP